MEWGDKYATDGEPPTVWQHSCGAELHPETVCAHCGEAVRGEDLTAIKLGGVPA